MWESPSWIGNIITGKINSSISEANRQNEATIAQKNRENQAAIAEANRQNEFLIASDRNAANLRIAEISADTARLDRESRETISALDRESRESVAQAQRDNDYRIAQMKSGVDILNTGVRTVLPFALPFAFSAMADNSNNSNNSTKGPTINASAGSVSTKDKKSAKDRAREKAESLFPELEPTWSIDTSASSSKKSTSMDPLPALNNGNSFKSNLLNAFRNTTAAFGAAVLTGVTLAPFITI